MLRQKINQILLQNIDLKFFLCRNRQVNIANKRLLQPNQLFLQLLLMYLVDLIQNNDFLCLRPLKLLLNLLRKILSVDVDQQNQHIAIVHTFLHKLHHPLVHSVAGLTQNAGGIRKNDLVARAIFNTKNPVSGCLRLGVYDG